jgi:hypothetical protein
MEDGSTIGIGNLTIDANTFYSITNNLTNCISSNNITEIAGGSSYSATISANSGYELKSVVVRMGGTDISASAVSGGSINIANVTGNIVITAVAEVAGPAYTNQIPISTDANGNLFVGTNGEKGYKTDTRVSLSSGNESGQSGYEITGFIPVKLNDTIRIKNIDVTNDNYTNIAFYDSSKVATKGSATTVGAQLDTFFVQNGTNTNGVYSVKLTSALHGSLTSAVAYCRISSKSITNDSIVTVNQEIV